MQESELPDALAQKNNYARKKKTNMQDDVFHKKWIFAESWPTQRQKSNKDEGEIQKGKSKGKSQADPRGAKLHKNSKNEKKRAPSHSWGIWGFWT